MVLIVFFDLTTAIGFSSFGVLVYYLIANLSAVRQPASERQSPRWVGIAGAIGCAVLVATLPATAVIGGLIMFAAGICYRFVRLSIQRQGFHPAVARSGRFGEYTQVGGVLPTKLAKFFMYFR